MRNVNLEIWNQWFESQKLRPNKPVTRVGFVLGLNWPPLFVSTGGMDKGGKWWGPGMAVQDKRTPEEVLAVEKKLRPETLWQKIKTKLKGA